MKLNKVTVTGADDSVQPEVLQRISEEYPFVEWGILVSESSKGKGRPRFPSDKWLAQLIETYDRSPLHMALSVHVCGSWVKRACAGDWEWLQNSKNKYVAGLFMRAERVQLNFHSYAHKVVMPDFVDALSNVTWKLILQSDGVNDDLIRTVHDGHPSTAILHDRSGGAGELPERWPPLVKGMYNGYAGGLSVLNVGAQLCLISQTVGEETIWIDAESQLRRMNNKQLSIPQVKGYLQTAELWVGNTNG